jgi:hypothetical protein
MAGSAEGVATSSNHELPSPVALQQRQAVVKASSVTGEAASDAISGPGSASSLTPRELGARAPRLHQNSNDGAAIKPQQLQNLQDAREVPHGPLVSKVAAAFQQQAPAGAFVVRDVKISRIAGELEPVLSF